MLVSYFQTVLLSGPEAMECHRGDTLTTEMDDCDEDEDEDEDDENLTVNFFVNVR